MTWELFIESIPYFLKRSLSMLLEFLPYFIAGIALGEILKFTSWTKTIYKWVSKSPIVAVISASVIGIISPLCTYGTIPIIIELYKSRVHIAPLVSFLSASALMNPQLFIMTLGGIGPEMAVVRTLAVFLFSFAAGMLAYIIPAKFIVKKNIDFYEDGAEKILNREKKLFVIKQLLVNCLKVIKNVGVYLLIGVLLGAAAEMYLPQHLIYRAVNEGRLLTILSGALLGIPMYVCGGGVIPLVRTMIDAGMGKGTALAFFIVGPATRPAPLAAMAALFTPLFLVGYCVLLIVYAVIVGFIYV